MRRGRGNLRHARLGGRAETMADFDRLPPELRAWIAGAVLPWSARSVRRAWGRALDRTRGDRAAALALMDRIEAATLARDAAGARISRAAAR